MPIRVFFTFYLSIQLLGSLQAFEKRLDMPQPGRLPQADTIISFKISKDTICPVECIRITDIKVEINGSASSLEPEFDPSTTKGMGVMNPSDPVLTICYPQTGVDSIVDLISFVLKLNGKEVKRTGKEVRIRWVEDGFPNAFSPNGDRLNDTFKPVFPCPVKMSYFSIYNRWGEKIFETTNPEAGWDGTVNGAQAPPDVYFWLVNYEAIRKGAEAAQGFSRKGDVTLLR